MLTNDINAALRRANYEVLSDNTFYGEIPGFRGVYDNAASWEERREQLCEVLAGWIVLGLRLGHTMPNEF